MTEVARQFSNQIKADGLPCDVFGDGMAVPITTTNWFEPDCLVRCGPPIDGDEIRIVDPLVVAEVVSPSSAGSDLTRKPLFYLDHSTIRHYLIVILHQKCVIQHLRRGEEWISRLVAEGKIVLDPPGLALDVGTLFTHRS